MIVSLLAFHRFLIMAGIVFCAGFAVWTLRAWAQSKEVGTLVLAVVFFVLAVGLILYLRRLGRFLGYDRSDDPRRP